MSDNNYEEYDVPPYTHYSSTLTANVHHFYISQKVEEPAAYIDMIHTLHVASSTDVVYFHLATPGGNLTTGVQLINAIKNSPAHIICSLESDVQSLGVLLFLSGDEWVVHNNSMIMIHNYSGTATGKNHEMMTYTEATTTWLNKFYESVLIPFLTPKELTSVFKGEDIYMQADEIRARLLKLVNGLKRNKKTN